MNYVIILPLCKSQTNNLTMKGNEKSIIMNFLKEEFFSCTEA
jgi:hypothetical protein